MQDAVEHFWTQRTNELESRLSYTEQQLALARDEAASAGMAAAQLQSQLDEARRNVHRLASMEESRSTEDSYRGEELEGAETRPENLREELLTRRREELLTLTGQTSRGQTAVTGHQTLQEAWQHATEDLVNADRRKKGNCPAEPQLQWTEAHPDPASTPHEVDITLSKVVDVDNGLREQIDALDDRLEKSQRCLESAKDVQKASTATALEVQELQAELASSREGCASLHLQLEAQQQLSTCPTDAQLTVVSEVKSSSWQQFIPST